ncbi:helix-turn-helix domain-containing protein [Actinoplanes sp. M2I2]|uniref:helix-turn-helix domain-containing protein n=1 Tax=Actinoplanes sp. M2I2 TaxID=1734444 RepID=UPI0035B16A06
MLRRHRELSGFSLRRLGAMTQFGFTFLSQVERGERRATENLAQRCDEALRAGGALIDAYRNEISSGEDMKRRTILRAMGPLAASPLPLVQWEALRQGVTASLDLDTDQWDQAVADYGIAYYRVPASQMMDNLRADITVLQALIPDTLGTAKGQLLRTVARLSVIVALNMVAAGQTLTAARWWRDSQNYARASGDADTVVLTRAWDVVNGCYDGRHPASVVALADDVLPLIEGRASASACGLLAGRAQALSLLGRHSEAVTTVRRLADVTAQLPHGVTEEVDSLWGWPEHRLRHTEAWVYAHAGDLSAAVQAQERAVVLYPTSLTRLRTQVQLHHAAALIRNGHVPDGLRLAADLLEQLPPEQHNELLRTVARQVIDAVPHKERRRPMFREVTDRVAT